MNINKYWQACLDQDEAAMAPFFHKEAVIRWHNTKEEFTAQEFIRINCLYPGAWKGNIKEHFQWEDMIITVVQVQSKDEKESHHVTSIMKIQDGQIRELDEYWGQDSEPPSWRKDLDGRQ